MIKDNKSVNGRVNIGTIVGMAGRSHGKSEDTSSLPKDILEGASIGVVKVEEGTSFMDAVRAIFSDANNGAGNKDEASSEEDEVTITDKKIRQLTIDEIAEYNRLVAWSKQTAELHDEIDKKMEEHDNRVDKLIEDKEAFWDKLRKNHLLSEESYDIDEASMTLKSKGMCNCSGCRNRRARDARKNNK